MKSKLDFKIWFDKAKDDLNTAKYNLSGSKFEAGIFFLQQTAEKALKALYIKKFKSLLKTHDLVILAKRINAPDNLIELCKKLAPSYQYTRYPDVIKVDNLDEISKDFLNYTEQILKWVKKKI